MWSLEKRPLSGKPTAKSYRRGIRGKWLLIRGSEVLDALDTFSEAAHALREMNDIALIQPVEAGMAKNAIGLPSVRVTG